MGGEGRGERGSGMEGTGEARIGRRMGKINAFQ